jgi:hypothetical protein
MVAFRFYTCMKKRLRGWIILVFVIILLFIFIEPIERYSDALLHAPWAYGWDSRGNLTDDWTTNLPNGQWLDITLARELGEDGLPTPADDSDAALTGSGRLCADGDTIAQFSLVGFSNRHGSRLRLTLEQQETGDVSGLSGSWSGDTIDLSGNLFNEPVSISLQRGQNCS